MFIQDDLKINYIQYNVENNVNIMFKFIIMLQWRICWV